jgi:hypothetical protein
VTCANRETAVARSPPRDAFLGYQKFRRRVSAVIDLRSTD